MILNKTIYSSHEFFRVYSIYIRRRWVQTGCFLQKR